MNQRSSCLPNDNPETYENHVCQKRRKKSTFPEIDLFFRIFSVACYLFTPFLHPCGLQHRNSLFVMEKGPPIIFSASTAVLCYHSLYSLSIFHLCLRPRLQPPCSHFPNKRGVNWRWVEEATPCPIVAANVIGYTSPFGAKSNASNIPLHMHRRPVE